MSTFLSKIDNNNFYGPSQLGYGGSNNANNQFGYSTNNQQNTLLNNQYQSNSNNMPSYATSNQFPGQFTYNNQYPPLNNGYQPSNYQQFPNNQYQPLKPNNPFVDVITGGGLNQINSNQNQNYNQPDLEKGMDIWADLMKNIDWDVMLKNKNFNKKQSDTNWITFQEESWRKEKPSDSIQKEADRKFAFPNPFIKYKIIPGVDEKMALDVTAKDDL